MTHIPKEQFNWGRVITDHEIGVYTIREHISKLSGNRQFHGYIDGKDTNESWDTLEQAIVGCIARKFDGPNSQAAMFFSRMIALTQGDQQ